jgi:short-subunit dehydrogenase
VVFPGAIATNITINSGLKNPASQEPDSVKSSFPTLPAPKAAEIIIIAMEKNKYRICVGKDSQFLDLLYRMFPQYAAGFISKKMVSLLK